MKIGDIRSPEVFQRLVHRLFVAERGLEFQIVDDSAGDRGNDGYDATRKILYAIYCPEKPATADYRRKATSDLAKARKLATAPGYDIKNWVFVTPEPLSERLQAELRIEASAHGLTAAFMSAIHLEDVYRRHPHLSDEFPELQYPVVAQKLSQVLEELRRAPRQVEPPADAAASPDPSTPHASASPSGALSGFLSPALEAYMHRFERGDESAVVELERYRMEASSPRDRLDALLIELQCVQDQGRRDRAFDLCRLGLELARQYQFGPELGAFAATLALLIAQDLSHMELDHEAEARMAAMVGIPLRPLHEIHEREQRITKLRGDVNGLFKEAHAAVEGTGSLLSMYIVVLKQGNALTNRFFGEEARYTFTKRASVAASIVSLKAQVERAYEVAVRIARMMNSDEHLATAYSNYANDLFAFGDRSRARAHAEHALTIAERVGYASQAENTKQLLHLIATRPSDDEGERPWNRV